MLPEVGSTIVPPGERSSPLLRVRDHRAGDAVLDASARVEPLELGEDSGGAAGEARELDERRPSDRVLERESRGGVSVGDEEFKGGFPLRR